MRQLRQPKVVPFVRSLSQSKPRLSDVPTSDGAVIRVGQPIIQGSRRGSWASYFLISHAVAVLAATWCLGRLVKQLRGDYFVFQNPAAAIVRSKEDDQLDFGWKFVNREIDESLEVLDLGWLRRARTACRASVRHIRIRIGRVRVAVLGIHAAPDRTRVAS